MSSGGCAQTLRAATLTTLQSPQSYTPKHLAERILTSKGALEGERKLGIDVHKRDSQIYMLAEGGEVITFTVFAPLLSSSAATRAIR